MNRYPVWKYAIIVIALLLGVVYTLPNFFGEAPAVQVSSSKVTFKVDTATLGKIEEALKAAGVQATLISLEGTSIRARFETTGLSNFDLAGSITTSNADQTFNSPITLSGDATLTSGSGVVGLGGNVAGAHNFGLNTTQAGGFDQGSSVFNVSGLQLQGGDYTLTNPANQIAALAGNVASVSLYDNASLTVGSLGGINGLSASGAVTLQTSAAHDITLNSAITSGAAGNAVVLASGRDFINGANAGAVDLTNPGSTRWLVYSSDPATDDFGSAALASGNAPLWNTTYSATPPSNVPSGNRYIFAYQPTVTFKGTDGVRKTYGVDAVDAVATSWSVLGLYAQHGAGNGNGTAYLVSNADIFSGRPAVTSSGAPASANAGHYDIDVARGSLSEKNSYVFAYAKGSLIVDPAILDIVNLSGGRVYDATSAFVSSELALNGVKFGDTVTVSGQASVASANVGHYASWLSSGLTLNNANYTLLGGSVAVDILARPITLTAGSNTNGTRSYGDASNPAVGYAVGGMGMANGENAQSLLGFTVGSSANNLTDAGTYGPGSANAYKVNGTAPGVQGNYNVTALSEGTLSVDKAHLAVAADDKARAYGDANPALSATLSGFKNGQTLATSGVSGEAALSTSATQSSNVGKHVISAAQGSLAAGNYDFTVFSDGLLAITPRPITLAAGSNDIGTRSYGDASNPAVGYAVGGMGMANGENAQSLLGFTVGSSANNLTDAGTYGPGSANAYKVNGTAPGVHGNYNVTALSEGTLSIDKARLTIAADNQSKSVGQSFIFNGTEFTAQGLVNAQTIASAELSSLGAPAPAVAGEYRIDIGNASGGTFSAANYAVTYQPGSMTVTGAAKPPEPVPPALTDPLQRSSGNSWLILTNGGAYDLVRPLSKVKYEQLTQDNPLPWLQSYLADTGIMATSELTGITEYQPLKVQITFDKYWGKPQESYADR